MSTFYLSTTNGRSIVLQASDDTERSNWIEAIQRLAFEPKRSDQVKGVLPQDLFLERIGQARSKHYDQRQAKGDGRNRHAAPVLSSGGMGHSPSSSVVETPPMSARGGDDVLHESFSADAVEDAVTSHKRHSRLSLRRMFGSSSSSNSASAVAAAAAAGNQSKQHSFRSRAASDADVRSASTSALASPSKPAESQHRPSKSNEIFLPLQSPVSPPAPPSASSLASAAVASSGSLSGSSSTNGTTQSPSQSPSPSGSLASNARVTRNRIGLTMSVDAEVRRGGADAADERLHASPRPMPMSMGHSRGRTIQYYGQQQMPQQQAQQQQYSQQPPYLQQRSGAAPRYHGRSSSSPANTISSRPPPELLLERPGAHPSQHHRRSAQGGAPLVPPSLTSWSAERQSPQQLAQMQAQAQLQQLKEAARASTLSGNHQKSSSIGNAPASGRGSPLYDASPRGSPTYFLPSQASSSSVMSSTPPPSLPPSTSSPSPPTSDRLHLTQLGQVAGDDRRMFDLVERVQGSSLDAQRVSMPAERRSRSVDLDTSQGTLKEDESARPQVSTAGKADSAMRLVRRLTGSGSGSGSSDPDVERAKRPPLSDGLAGYLYKKTPGTFGRSTWVRRWFCIREGLLMYGRRESDTSLAFAANLLHTVATPVDVPDRPACFELRSTYKTFVLQAPSEANMRLWISGVENAAVNRYRPDAKVREWVISGTDSVPKDDFCNVLCHFCFEFY